MNNRLINTKVAAAGGCTDIVDNYDPFGGGLALYQLNGNANDSSPNAYNGTWSGTESYSTGVFGQAANFSGTNYIETSLRVGQDWSVSFWINSSAFSDQQRVAQTFNSIDDIGFQFRGETDGTMLFWAVNGGSSNVADGTIVRSANTWYHIVGTYSYTNSKITLYVNGQQDVSATANLDVSNSTYPIRIGQQVGGSDSQDYKLDQVRVFNTALDPLEVEALYTEELCICDGTVDTLDILGDGSCIATYQLDGNANDLSGNYSGEATDVSYGVGEFDLAGVFNGSPSVITVPRNNNLDMNHNSSFSAWINVSDLTQTNVVAGQGRVSFTDGWYLALRPSPLEISLAVDYGTSFDVRATNTMVENTWYHIVAVNTGSKLQVYLNGNIVIDSTANTGNSNSTNGDFTLGKYPHAAGYFYGSIDQVRIFNKALDQNDVDTLFAETACTKAACTGTTHTLNILGGGDTSCIAAYPLDGSPADLSGNYNGVQTDVTYPQGYFDLAGSFNGSSSYIDNLPTVTNIAASFSISVWFNSSVTPSATEFIIGAIANQGGATNLDSVLVIQINTSQDIALTLRGNNGVSYTITATGSYSDNQWHHIVGTVSTTTAALYVDDNLINTTSVDDSITVDNLVIGARDNRGNTIENFFDGEIDQVRIFNKALSAGEVTTLYNETPCN